MILSQKTLVSVNLFENTFKTSIEWFKKYCRGTLSGHKLLLCVPEISVLGYQYTLEG
jgi:hypothetical protein